MQNRVIGIWLFIGVLMVFIQVLIGGVTRITGSGLSITKWEIVTGTIPPLDNATWQSEFDLYKKTPQYQKINKGMSLKEFKFIYFWEYFHRLWARLMGLVFAIPFAYFFIKKWFQPGDVRKLAGVIALASVVAGFGWIMVQSGLIDKPWVSPFKLSIHLILAILLFVYLLVLTFQKLIPGNSFYTVEQRSIGKLPLLIIFALFIQVFLGGMMSGMKAGINYPTFPLMNGELIPPVLFSEFWSLRSLVDLESSSFATAFVQFFHRMFAFIVLILVTLFGVKLLRNSNKAFSQYAALYLLAAVLFQFTLGIITVIKCKGGIPLFWGVMHQAFALVLISAVTLNIFLISISKRTTHESDSI